MKKKKSGLKLSRHRNKYTYLEKLKEWQEHQYDPGYYTGGNVPPQLTHPGRPLLLGWLFVIMSIAGGIISTVFVVIGFDKEQLFAIIIWMMLYLGVFTIFLFAGIKLIQKGRLQEKGKAKTVNIKRIGAVISAIALVCIFMIGIYNANTLKGELTITSSRQFLLSQKENHNYVYVKEIDKTLIITKNEYFVLRSMRTADLFQTKSGALKIDYVWNNFSPQRGKVTKVTELEGK